MDLTGDQWLLIQPLIPPPSPAAGRGRPLINERAVLNGILWKFRHNAAWYDIPDRYPSFQTCYRRYRLWRRLGVMQAILRTLYRDMCDRGGLYLENAFQDDTIVISPHGCKLKFQVDPQVQDTWQLSTALIFVWMVIKNLKKR